MERTRAADVIDAVVANEPAKAVDATQSAIVDRIRDLIAGRVDGNAAAKDEVDSRPAATGETNDE